MKYKRNEYAVFSLGKIMEQLIEYLKVNKSLPKTIFLPPAEYVMINYLFDIGNMPNRQITKFIGITLKVDYSEQDTIFQGI